MIPYEDVLFMMRNCVAVINPSRFEGWSSTVEEAKSIGKRVLLSDIPVHREQNPNHALYFGPDDLPGVCSAILNVWNVDEVAPPEWQREAAGSLRERTRCFGEKYLRLVETVLNNHISADSIASCE